MNFKKKALLPAIAMVLVSVIALSGVSYAWFTLSPKATVGELSLNVVAAEGLQISVDADKWVSKLEQTDIVSGAYEGSKNMIPTAAVAPVSTAGTIAAGDMVFFNGSTQDGTKLTTTAATISDGTGNFYAFDLFFNILDKDVTLKLGAGSIVTSADGVETCLASRVAFVNCGTAATPALATALTATAESAKVIWEPRAEERSKGARDQGITTGVTSYKGVSAAGTDFDPSTDTTYLSAVSTATYAEGANHATAADQTLFTISKGITKVRVYIWLEGQDVDCTNDISGNSFTTLLNFVRADS